MDDGDLSLPVDIRGDLGYIMGMMRLAQNGDLGLVGHIHSQSLGAPFVGNLNDFPLAERAIVWAGGMLARVIGLYPASNIMVLSVHILAALSFYYAARLWRISTPIAWALALVYCFIPQTTRAPYHLGSTFFGLLPLQLYTCWYIALSSKISHHSSRFKLALTIGVLSGLLNIYWIAFFSLTYVISLAYRLLKRKRTPYATFAPILLTGIIASLFLGSFILYQIQNGRNLGAAHRIYHYVEATALKPIDLVIPRTGQAFGLFRELYTRYVDGKAIMLSESDDIYIRIASISGLAALLFSAALRQRRGPAPSIPFLLLI